METTPFKNLKNNEKTYPLIAIFEQLFAYGSG